MANFIGPLTDEERQQMAARRLPNEAGFNNTPTPRYKNNPGDPFTVQGTPDQENTGNPAFIPVRRGLPGRSRVSTASEVFLTPGQKGVPNDAQVPPGLTVPQSYNNYVKSLPNTGASINSHVFNPRSEFFQGTPVVNGQAQSDYRDHSVGNFFKALPGALLKTAVQAPVKLFTSGFEGVDQAFKTGGKQNASGHTYHIPGLEPFKSFQSDAADRADAGQNPLLNAGEGALGVGGAALQSYGLFDALNKTGDIGSDLLDRARGLGRPSEEDFQNKALEAVTPSYKQAAKGAYQSIKGPNGEIIPRINEADGNFAARTVNNTPLEKDAANELAQIPEWRAVVDGPNPTALKQFNAIQPRLLQADQLLKENLSHYPVDAADFRSTLEDDVAKIKSDALHADTNGKLPSVAKVGFAKKIFPSGALQKYAFTLQNKLDSLAKKPDLTAADLVSFKQEMTQFYEDLGGKFAKSDPSAPPVKALDDLQQGLNNSIKDYLDKATSGQSAAQIKSTWDLHRASDELLSKWRGEPANFAERHPQISRMAKTGISRSIWRIITKF